MPFTENQKKKGGDLEANQSNALDKFEIPMKHQSSNVHSVGRWTPDINLVWDASLGDASKDSIKAAEGE